MFWDFSARETLLWIGGTLLAAVIAFWGLFYLIDNVVMRDLDAPLVQQGGLTADQDIRKK